MPVWSREEVDAAHQHIFSSQPAAEVDERFYRWGGLPRYVLQLRGIAHQRFLENAVRACSLRELISCMTDLSTAGKINQWLVHAAVSEDYTETRSVLASDWVEGRMLDRCREFWRGELREYFAASGGSAAVADFRLKLWERHARTALQKGGTFTCRALQAGTSPFQLEMQPADNAIRSSGLFMQTFGSGSSLMQCNHDDPVLASDVAAIELIQMTVTAPQRGGAEALAFAIAASEEGTREVKLYFAMPPQIEPAQRCMLDGEAGRAAHAVKQYLLQIDV